MSRTDFEVHGVEVALDSALSSLHFYLTVGTVSPQAIFLEVNKLTIKAREDN